MSAHMGWFVAGFVAHALIAYVSARSHAWRIRREWKRQLKQHMAMPFWLVRFKGIKWDADLTTLPHDLEICVAAADHHAAITRALDEASDQHCFLILDVRECEVSLGGRTVHQTKGKRSS